MLSSENETLKDKLYVLLKKDYYELDRKINELVFFLILPKRPLKTLKKTISNFGINTKDRHVRNIGTVLSIAVICLCRKIFGRENAVFFIPQIWVELSKRYLDDVFGENWQDEC